MTVENIDATSQPASPATGGSRRDAIVEWLLADGPRVVSTADVATHFGWPHSVTAQALVSAARAGVLSRPQRGRYAIPKASKDTAPRKAPQLPQAEPTADPYVVVDAVLGQIFPRGVAVGSLAEVIAWREATAKLLRLVEMGQ